MHVVTIGGSDAGISAALRARELDPDSEVTVVVADAYPNFSICGIPYYLSGEVTDWRNLAHRTIRDLEATGMRLRLDTTARRSAAPGKPSRSAPRPGSGTSTSTNRLRSEAEAGVPVPTFRTRLPPTRPETLTIIDT